MDVVKSSRLLSVIEYFLPLLFTFIVSPALFSLWSDVAVVEKAQSTFAVREIATFPVHALSLLKVVDVGYYTDHVLALMTHHAVGTVEINIVSQRCKLLCERFAYREY